MITEAGSLVCSPTLTSDTAKRCPPQENTWLAGEKMIITRKTISILSNYKLSSMLETHVVEISMSSVRFL